MQPAASSSLTAAKPTLGRNRSTVYRLGKFVRRHRFGVTLSAVAVLLLVGFAARERLQSTRIAAERDRANLEAETANWVAGFMKGLFEVSDPGEARGNTITARELLDVGAEKIEGLTDQPELQRLDKANESRRRASLRSGETRRPVFRQCHGCRRARIS